MIGLFTGYLRRMKGCHKIKIYISRIRSYSIINDRKMPDRPPLIAKSVWRAPRRSFFSLPTPGFRFMNALESQEVYPNIMRQRG